MPHDQVCGFRAALSCHPSLQGPDQPSDKYDLQKVLDIVHSEEDLLSGYTTPLELTVSFTFLNEEDYLEMKDHFFGLNLLTICARQIMIPEAATRGLFTSLVIYPPSTPRGHPRTLVV